MAHVSVEPDPAAVAAIAPEKPEPATAPAAEVSRFYDFLSLPLPLSFLLITRRHTILLCRLFTLALLGVCARYQRKGDFSFIYSRVLCVR